MYCLYFICERKFYARKNYATLEINPKSATVAFFSTPPRSLSFSFPFPSLVWFWSLLSPKAFLLTPFYSNFVRLVFKKTSLTCMTIPLQPEAIHVWVKLLVFLRGHLVQCDFKKLQCFFGRFSIENKWRCFLFWSKTMKRLFFALWFSF